MTFYARTGDEPMDGFIYVIGCEPTDWAPKPPLVKIGWAKVIDNRVYDLAIGSPLILKVLDSFPGSRRLEAWLHRNFADRCDHGEWFRMAAPDQLERIEKAADRYKDGDDRFDVAIEDITPDPEAVKRWRSLRSRQRSA